MKTWKTTLRVPSRHVMEVAQRLQRVKKLGSVRVTDVEARARSIVVTVEGEDIRVNTVSDLLAQRIPAKFEVQFPYWG